MVEGSCILPEYGCLSPLYLEYNALANTDSVPSLCSSLIVYGCMDSEAANYNEAANINAISASNFEEPCEEVRYGCTIQGMICFDPDANTLDAASCFNCPDTRSIRSRSADTIIYCSANYNEIFDSESDLLVEFIKSCSVCIPVSIMFGFDIFCTDGPSKLCFKMMTILVQIMAISKFCRCC